MTELLYKKLMYFWSLCFFIAGLFFITQPQVVILGINLLSQTMEWNLLLPQTFQFLWWALSGAMMMTIAYLSFEVGRHPTQKQLANALLICKGGSSFLFMVAALKYNKLYFVGTAVDLPIFLIILFSTLSFNRQRVK